MNAGRRHQQRGRETEAIVVSELIRRGFSVSTPAFGHDRYDLVLDREGTLERVQVKTAYDHHEHEDTVVVEFDCTVYSSDGTAQRTYYGEDEIDSFLAYCPDRAVVLYIPHGEAPKTQMNFSFRSKSSYGDGNRKAINFAQDYTLDAQL